MHCNQSACGTTGCMYYVLCIMYYVLCQLWRMFRMSRACIRYVLHLWSQGDAQHALAGVCPTYYAYALCIMHCNQSACGTTGCMYYVLCIMYYVLCQLWRARAAGACSTDDWEAPSVQRARQADRGPPPLRILVQGTRIASVSVTPAQAEAVPPLQDKTGFGFNRTLKRGTKISPEVFGGRTGLVPAAYPDIMPGTYPSIRTAYTTRRIPPVEI